MPDDQLSLGRQFQAVDFVLRWQRRQFTQLEYNQLVAARDTLHDLTLLAQQVAKGDADTDEISESLIKILRLETCIQRESDDTSK